MFALEKRTGGSAPSDGALEEAGRVLVFPRTILEVRLGSHDSRVRRAILLSPPLLMKTFLAPSVRLDPSARRSYASLAPGDERILLVDGPAAAAVHLDADACHRCASPAPGTNPHRRRLDLCHSRGRRAPLLRAGLPRRAAPVRVSAVRAGLTVQLDHLACCRRLDRE